jgi:hypothetical protein
MLLLLYSQPTTADVFAAAIEEIKKADIFSKTLPYDVIVNIKKYALLNLLKKFESVLAFIRRVTWNAMDEILFLPQILFDVTEMLNYMRDVFGNRILADDVFIELADPWKTSDDAWEEFTLPFLTDNQEHRDFPSNPNITWEIAEVNPIIPYEDPVNVQTAHNNLFGLVQHKRCIKKSPRKNKKHNVRNNA